MLYCLIQFKTKIKGENLDLEDLAVTFMHSLVKSGHIIGDFIPVWVKGTLNFHVLLARPDALNKKYFAKWSLEYLEDLKTKFKVKIESKIIDDDLKKRHKNWRLTNFIYLMPNTLTIGNPLFCGNNGDQIPNYLMPITDIEKEDLYFWSSAYYYHYNIWLNSGELEFDAYRQLADLKYQISKSGRELSAIIEKATGIPTYYYLFRFYGRKEVEENRRCPLCGKNWQAILPKSKRKEFWHFDFMCHKCRLVSHEADSFDGERLARIGEFSKKKISNERSK